MGSSATKEYIDCVSQIADRYRVERLLGEGGIAVVYQVHDNQTGRSLALKQFKAREDNNTARDIIQLFEHEYHTLTQLVHPSVIEVYDFGKDDIQPYYTMELLDGGDLYELAPLEWKKACSLTIDICSALSLLHSRRQVHRDISPRNIRCTKEDKAKLIDFGAMVPMGPCKRVIGTPAYTAPEILGLQSLDARTDLYSLGASLYYLLTGHNAYSAKTFAAIRDILSGKPFLPSYHVKDIPTELDDLVMSLIELDPMARPANAALVMERLSAIAGIELENQLSVSQAYLTTPMLVAREKGLSCVKQQMARTLAGGGGVVFIQGDSGVGRSRFLDACVLEGKLAGATVIKVDATDARSDNWGVVRAVGSRLLDAIPDLALTTAEPHLSVLGHVLPELVDRFEDRQARASGTTDKAGQLFELKSHQAETSRTVELRRLSFRSRPLIENKPTSFPLEHFDNPKELRSRVQAALRKWILQISNEHCLVLAVDDLHRIDEPSAAFVGLLSQEISNSKLMMAVTTVTDAPNESADVIRLLKKSGQSVGLKNLDLEHTKQLLYSMFGEADNVEIVADRIQTISQGNPRAIMQLAQHLVDRAIVSYRSGCWTLPDNIAPDDLPDSINQALKARLQELPVDALKLAQTMALIPEQNLSHEECLLLTEHRDPAQLIQNLDQLVARQIVLFDGEYFSFGQEEWISILNRGIDPPSQRALNLRLAEVFEKRGTDRFRVAQHLMFAGESDRALDEFIAFSRISNALTAKDPDAYSNLVLSLPNNWHESMSAAIRLAKQRGRPLRQVYEMQSRYSGLSVRAKIAQSEPVIELIEQLSCDSGLVLYHELGESVAENERLSRALELAQQRYDASPESERVLAPLEAIPQLARAISTASGVITRTFEIHLWQSVPSLEPFFPLSPLFAIIERLTRAMTYYTEGRVQESHRINQEILDLIAQPDPTGAYGTYYRYWHNSISHIQGMYEAIMGRKSALQRASHIESSPLSEDLVWRVRMLHHQWQGNSREADEYRKQLELMLIEKNNSRLQFAAMSVPMMLAYCLADDHLGVKRSVDEIRIVADAYPGWVPTLHYAQGEYQRIVGNYPRAFDLLKQSLDRIEAGKYRGWPSCAGAYIKTLLALKRYGKANAEGDAFLQAAERENLGFVADYIKMPLALAKAKLGDYQTAVEQSEAVIEGFKQLGSTGLNLGLAYENRAYVAISTKDVQGFNRFSELCAEQFNTGENQVLNAKYQRLTRQAERAGIVVRRPFAHTGDGAYPNVTSYPTADLTEVGIGPRQRAERAIELLVNNSNSLGGFLYTIQKQGPVLVSQYGDQKIPSAMDKMVNEYLAIEIDDREDVTQTCDEDKNASKTAMGWTGSIGDRYRPILVSHHTRVGMVITGLVVLRIDPEKSFRFPTQELATVSKILADAGDVVSVTTGT